MMMIAEKEGISASSSIQLTYPKEDPERTGDVTGVERLSWEMEKERTRRQDTDSAIEI